MSIVSNVPFYDLRTIKNPCEAQSIVRINEVPVVIMPKSPREPKVLWAIRGIDVTDSACVIDLEDNAVIRTCNGLCELDGESFNRCGYTLYIVNGICFMHDIPENVRGGVVVNGMLIVAKNLKGKINLDIPLVNGRVEYVDADKMMSYDNKVTISREFLGYVKQGTLIVSGNKIEVEPDVDAQTLDRSGITLLAAGKICCDEKLFPYMQVHAFYGNKISEL